MTAIITFLEKDKDVDFIAKELKKNKAVSINSPSEIIVNTISNNGLYSVLWVNQIQIEFHDMDSPSHLLKLANFCCEVKDIILNSNKNSITIRVYKK